MDSEYFTNMERSDGFGGQFQSILWTLLYLEKMGKQFAYTDIKTMEHISKRSNRDTYEENTMDEVVDYMAIKKNYINSNNIDNASKLNFWDAYSYIDNNIDSIFTDDNLSFKKFKNFFYEGKTSRFDSDYFNVAIHIRRAGNLDIDNNSFLNMFHNVPNEYYIENINNIRNKYPNKNLKFHIYSQGDIKDFQDMSSDDVVFHLNEKTLDTFNDFIFADVLVTSRGSFSYLAGLLSNNDVFYLNFGHNPLSRWCNTVAEGKVSRPY